MMATLGGVLPKARQKDEGAEGKEIENETMVDHFSHRRVADDGMCWDVRTSTARA
jgi:hypothetical protein